MTYAPKRPWRRAWSRVDETRWFHEVAHLLVVSSVDHAKYRGEVVPQYQVSVSVVSERFRRATDAEVALVLRDFGMLGAEEDNHEPGAARHFWRLCTAPRDVVTECECKETEEVVVEADGHRWSRERRADG